MRTYRESDPGAKAQGPAQRPGAKAYPHAGQKSGTERAIHAQGGNAMAVPFDQRPDLVWFDGKLIPTADCTINVLTHGLHYASAVFEGERAYGGEIFKSIEHSERLKRSAQLMDFEIPYSVAEIEAAKRLVLEKNNQKDAYVRPIAWRGSQQLGVSAQNNKIHLAIATWEWPSYFDPAQRLKGIRLDLAEYRRPDPRTAPALAKASCLYAICTISKHRAERRGFADAMMLDWQGRVAECTGANIFFIKDGRIYTPIADCFLSGITRATAIALARRHNIEVTERRIMPEELSGFSECFITGTAAEVTAVSQIADWSFTPSRITQQLMSDYTAEVQPKGKAAAA
jgi:branched-chain amino acid aminotransferase